jgi:hypothetical protein
MSTGARYAFGLSGTERNTIEIAGRDRADLTAADRKGPSRTAKRLPGARRTIA